MPSSGRIVTLFLDVVITSEILYCQFYDQLFWNSQYILSIGFILLSPLQLMTQAKRQNCVSWRLLTMIALISKVVILWGSTQSSFKIRICPNGIIIFQLLMLEKEKISQHAHSLLLMVCSLNIVTFETLSGIFDPIQVFEVIQITISVIWVIIQQVKFKQQYRPTTQQTPTFVFGKQQQDKCLSELGHRNSIVALKQLDSPSEVREPWLWLQSEKFIVLSSRFHLTYSTFNLSLYVTSYQQQQLDAVQSVHALLASQIRIQQTKLKKIFSLIMSNDAIELKDLLQQLNQQYNVEQVFSSVVLQNSQIEMPNHIVNIFALVKGEQIFHILHFQEIPRASAQNQILVDICKSLSHELGTCLNCIVALSSAALEDTAVSNRAKQDYLKPIHINSEQLNLIISNIRDYNGIEINQFELRLTNVNVREECQYIASHFEEACNAKRINLGVMDNEIMVYTDQQRFRQVLYQLISNAVRFTPYGTISISYELLMDNIIVSISDSGTGMTQDEQIKLQKLLTENVLTRVSESSVGSGLGLYITNQIVKKLDYNDNSQISFVSSPQTGTIFTFAIKNMKKTLDQLSHSASPQIRKGSIMIVERFGSYVDNKVQNMNDKLQLKQQQSKVYTTSLYSTDQFSIHSKDNTKIQDKMKQLPIYEPKFKTKIMKQLIKSNCCSTVLIVDDEFFNIKSLQILMKRYNTQFDSAYNGMQAINMVKNKSENPCEVCKRKGYALIFLDINMPIMGGIETMKELKRMTNNHQIVRPWCIANTGFSDLETKIQSYDAGIDFFLTKPLCPGELYDIVNKIFPNG